MTEHTEIGGELVLFFMKDGTAELLEDDEVVWSSDADDDFRKQFEDELLSEDDAEAVLEYLCDEGILEEDELGAVTIEVEENGIDSRSEPVIEMESENGVDFYAVEGD